MAAKKVRIRLKKSLIGRKPEHRKTIKALGLGKINSSSEKTLNPAIKGMLKAVAFLIDIEEIK